MEKEKVKLSLFIDDMILYIENPKESTHTQHFVRALSKRLKTGDLRVWVWAEVIGIDLTVQSTKYKKKKLAEMKSQQDTNI